MLTIKIGSGVDKGALVEASARAAAERGWVELSRPLTSLALNARMIDQFREPTRPGFVLSLPCISLPIGTEVRSMTCTPEDIERWQAINITFGVLNLVNPQGTMGGVNLSAFDARVPHEDKVTPFILSKTKVDVQVTAQLQNCTYLYGLPKAVEPSVPGAPERIRRWWYGTPGVTALAGRGVEAVFHGFAIHAFQEEQVCAIQTRIEPTDRNVGCGELISMFRMHLYGASSQRWGNSVRVENLFHHGRMLVRSVRDLFKA